MVARSEWKNLIEMLALHPQLEFAGGVSDVFAAFKHRDHDDLNGDWIRRGS
jgi:hypothetical protein